MLLLYNNDRFIPSINNDQEKMVNEYKKSLLMQRYISKSPERILDAPELNINSNLDQIDWSSKNILAVVLDKKHIYFWDGMSHKIRDLKLTISNQITCIKWYNKLLAIASDNKIFIYNYDNNIYFEININFKNVNNFSWINNNLIYFSTINGNI